MQAASGVTFKEEKQLQRPPLPRTTTYYNIKTLKTKYEKDIREEKTDRVFENTNGKDLHNTSSSK